MRRGDDPEYQDDPEFSRFAEDLSVKLFGLTSNISRLSQQINLLGTKRDTERVRERVHDLLEEARDGFKEVGEGIKRLTSWDDLNVSLLRTFALFVADHRSGYTEIHSAEAIARIPSVRDRVPSHSTSRAREAALVCDAVPISHRLWRYIKSTTLLRRAATAAATTAARPSPIGITG